MFPNLDQLKNQVIEVGKKLIEYKLVLATWGNLSCRIPDTNHIIITPSGLSYNELSPEDLVVLDLEGNIIEGTKKPSTEVPMHCYIYKNRIDIQAVVHSHSVFASAFAVVRESIPPITEDMAQLIGGPVNVAKYALPGTEELARYAVEGMEERNAVLLANHGVVTVGATLHEAFTVSLLVEKSAQVMQGAKLLGTPYVLDQQEVQMLRDSFLKGYGQKAKKE